MIKLKSILLTLFLAALLSVTGLHYFTGDTKHYDSALLPQLEKHGIELINEQKQIKEYKKPRREWSAEYNKKLYYPENYPPSIELLNRLQGIADKMPKENTENAILPWKNIGPFGFQIRGGGSAFHSGRARDFDYSQVTGKFTVAVGTGGIFRYNVIAPHSIGDNLPLCNINTIACEPTDTNVVFAGTGEEGVGYGIGLLKTSNSGSTWITIPMAPGNEYPNYIFKIRYSQQNPQVLFSATISGLQRSTNGGSNWTMQHQGLTTDFVVNPLNNNVVYTGVVSSSTSSGIFVSRDGGNTFTEIGSGTLPPDNSWGNVKLAISAADTSRLYISIAKPDGSTQGAYRSNNSGVSWSVNINPDPVFHWNNQGLRNNAIGVSQTNANLVFLGGGPMIKSTDGGTTWNYETTPNGHVDATRFVTLPDGRIYWMHDGGISASVTNGSTWTTALLNNLPTVEFYTIATPMNEKLIIAGGTQDNGTPVYDNTGFWYSGNGGDGAGVTIDPVNTNRMICFDWNHGGYASHRHKTTDYFISNNPEFNNGIPPNSYFWGTVRHDFTPGVYFYTNSGPFIYSSDNSMTTWVQMNSSPFPHEVINFSVTPYLSGSSFIYACLNNPSPDNISKLRVFDGIGWSERNSGLPASRNIQHVAILKTDKNTAVAVVSGVGTPGQKIFKTGNAGLNWINITGNFEDLPITSVLIDQDVPSIIYVGTEGYGIFRTVNNGLIWSAWNYGMPKGARIRELTCIDSAGSNFTVVAGTYGRSVFLRDADDDDPVSINGNTGIVKDFHLSQNFPNPFNPSTKISFSLPAEENVILKVFDITGRETGTLVNQKMKAGVHEISFDGNSLSSGVYFYRIQTSRFTDVKKMILVK